MRRYPKNVRLLAHALQVPLLPSLVRYFLYDQLSPNARQSGAEAGLDACPEFDGNITVFPSAIATYYAPSDPSGPRGMHREQIRSVASWRGGPPRRDCVYVSHDSANPGFRGLLVARVHLFFAFTFQYTRYECALVSWYSSVQDTPDSDTGMWVVEPDMDGPLPGAKPTLQVISLDSILRGAHLIGVCGDDFLPREVGPSEALDVFRQFYVNKFADHHAFEIAF